MDVKSSVMNDANSDLAATSEIQSSVAQLIKLPSRSGLTGCESASYTEIVRESLGTYTNQVGGHKVLVKPKDSSMVLKPYDEAEYRFYDQCVPVSCSTLMPFTARCFGEVDIRQPSPETSSSGDGPVSPGKSGKYVMLEDLAHGFQKPCILDLKMGIQQRSVRNYSAQKVQSKSAKSLMSTSHKIGFRLGGAQLYRGGESLSFFNKYFGRVQDVEGTFSILKSFFASVEEDGVRSALIGNFIQKLVELKSVIQQLKGYRFWSGSLLLIYDCTDAMLNTVTVKMIDFANYTFVPSSPDPDLEYIFGIACLVEFFQAILANTDCPVPASQRPDPQVQDSELVDAVERYRLA